MKQIEIKQSSFFQGISDDPRATIRSGFVVSKNFDIFTNPFRLTPYRSFKDDQTSTVADDMKQYYVKDFLYSSTSNKLYGLGQTVGTGLTKIVLKNSSYEGNWTLPANSEGNGAVKNGCLVEYKDFLWGFQGTTQVFKWGLLSGTPSITNSAGTVGTVKGTVTGVTVNAAGTGYFINDVLSVTQGNNTCRLLVSAVSGTTVTGVTILEAGYNQVVKSALETTTSGAGTGCKINITTVADTTTTISSIAQGLIGRDDNLYLPYNNILVRVYPSGTVQDQALKLPTNLKITSLTNFGNYLAIATAPKEGFNGVSKVFLWNFTSPDIQEVIDWGEGELKVLETIEGMLIGITDRYLNNATGAGRGSLIIQASTGGSPQVLKEVFTAKLTGVSMPRSKTVKNNRLFFTAKIMTNDAGTEYNEGIWSFGRKNASYPYALSLDYSADNIQTFDSAANFFYISHSGDGSILKTNENAVYTEPSILETQIYNFGNAEMFKRLDRVKVSFRKLITGEELVVKYKIDNGSWITIGTFDTVNEISVSFVKELNKEFSTGKEFQFRFESTGGLEITGFTLLATELSTI
jgi:hypothetical protein